MEIKISCLIILIFSIMTTYISANLLKKSKLLQTNEIIPNFRNNSQPLSSDAKATIDVVGQARRTVESDFIKINIQITTNELTAHASMEKNNLISEELESLITSFDISIQNITTINFNLSPHYNYTNGTSIFAGYQTSNSLELTLSNLKLAGKVIDAISKIDNVQVNSVYFGVSSQKVEQTKDSLIDEAVGDAQRIAGLTLRRMNNEVKSVENISINNYGSFIPIARQSRSLAKEAQSSPTFYGNKHEIVISVLITFRIGLSNQ